MSDIKAGDTVRSYDEEFEVVVAEADILGYIIGRDEHGAYKAVNAGAAVKVEPTPADLYALVSASGSVTHEDYSTAHRYASEWNARPDLYAGCPWRIARFAFAEFMDTEAVES